MRYILQIQFFGTGTSKAGGGSGGGGNAQTSGSMASVDEINDALNQYVQTGNKVEDIMQRRAELQNGRVIDYQTNTVTLANGTKMTTEEYDKANDDLMKEYQAEVDRQRRLGVSGVATPDGSNTVIKFKGMPQVQAAALTRAFTNLVGSGVKDVKVADIVDGVVHLTYTSLRDLKKTNAKSLLRIFKDGSASLRSVSGRTTSNRNRAKKRK